MGAVLLLLLAGLAGQPSGNRTCGSYERDLADQAGHTAEQQCLIEAFRRGVPAQLSIRTRTIEGDPFSVSYRVLRAGLVLVRADATRDRYGSGKADEFECRALEFGPGYPRHSECVPA